jgi:TPR repeat protein
MTKRRATSNHVARFNLAASLATGDGKKQDLKRAVSVYRDLMRDGFGEAAFNLATMYARGEGVRQSWPQALKLFAEAEEMGSGNASVLLAELRLSGNMGLRRSRVMAVGHCARAMLARDARGLRLLRDLMDSRTPLKPEELRKGFALAAKAAGLPD